MKTYEKIVLWAISLGPSVPTGYSTQDSHQPFGVIPKKHQPGKWRLITDMSFPEDQSINDCIDQKLCSHNSGRHGSTAITLGRGALIAKTDIKLAYWLGPVYVNR